ncbi:MAG TPA: phospholipase D-like domain-containing protein [Acidobacteriaceae bacterium]|jgi:phosphatidylserine/phosphatidylglycerophosphate/cardiolipin synthase-like enzyme
MIWRSLRFLLFVLIGFNLFLYMSHHFFSHRLENRYAAAQDAENENSPIYFSPDTNLEQIDVATISHAQHSIDIAMFAFTDRRIATALRCAAEHGVKVRIYRDRSQYEEEEQRGGGVRSILAGERNISIKVKNSKELMHEKAALFDGHLLRDGSSNWSISAARYQDNEISLSDSESMAHAFATNFERMWARADNSVVQ